MRVHSQRPDVPHRKQTPNKKLYQDFLVPLCTVCIDLEHSIQSAQILQMLELERSLRGQRPLPSAFREAISRSSLPDLRRVWRWLIRETTPGHRAWQFAQYGRNRVCVTFDAPPIGHMPIHTLVYRPRGVLLCELTHTTATAPIAWSRRRSRRVGAMPAIGP